MSDVFNVGSAASLYIPATIAVFYQPFFVGVILLLSATFSTLYHSSDEMSYITTDEIFATVAFLLIVFMLTLLAFKHGVLSFRVLVPFIIGVAGTVIYTTVGNAQGVGETLEGNTEVYHAVWHVCTTVAALLVVVQDVPWNMFTKKYPELKRGNFLS